MLFGKHINRYYLKYLPAILFGIVALVVVDYIQLVVPEFYRSLVNGLIDGTVTENGTEVPFDMNYLLDKICLPLITDPWKNSAPTPSRAVTGIPPCGQRSTLLMKGHLNHECKPGTFTEACSGDR